MKTAQRDPVRTRRALLDAAARMLVTHGTGLTLDIVAREAQVSKGGLLHHFRSRDELLLALSDDWIESYDDAVRRHLDSGDDRPGRWCRAHIRAVFDPQTATAPWVHAAVQAALVGVPGVLQRAQTATQRWQREMASDGLHPQRVLLISRALDGYGAEITGDGKRPADHAALQALLLGLADQNGPLIDD